MDPFAAIAKSGADAADNFAHQMTNIARSGADMLSGGSAAAQSQSAPTQAPQNPAIPESVPAKNPAASPPAGSPPAASPPAVAAPPSP